MENNPEQMDLDFDIGVSSTPSLNSHTISIDPSLYSSFNTAYTTGSITYPTTYTWSSDYSISSSFTDTSVSINDSGLTMKEDCDIKIGNRSLKEFMNQVGDQLAILTPAPELEEKWDQLRNLRRQYEELKQDIIEKEKIMDILKK